MNAISRRPTTSNALFDQKSLTTLKTAVTQTVKTAAAGVSGYVIAAYATMGAIEVWLNQLGHQSTDALNLGSAVDYGPIGAAVGAALYAAYALSDANNFKS